MTGIIIAACAVGVTGLLLTLPWIFGKEVCS